jgi:hypothetical protein
MNSTLGTFKFDRDVEERTPAIGVGVFVDGCDIKGAADKGSPIIG